MEAGKSSTMSRNGGTQQRQDDSDDSDVEGSAGVVFPLVGDVIGDTAYSERFVLRVLMKFANLKVFKRVINVIKAHSFEAELCALLEMTAERDVVLFLLKHDSLNLFSFAMPVLEKDDQRIGELIVAIIANMCCHKESVAALIQNKTLISLIMNYLKTDNTATINHALRILSHCIFQTEEEHRKIWMDIFVDINYTANLCFILKNSTNKDLLITALENFNTLCEYLNIKCLRKDFFKQFVTPEVLEAVSVAFEEIMTKQRSLRERDCMERILAITLQIGLNLVWFDNTLQIFSENRSCVVTMISQILGYYEHKIVNNKLIDTDVEDIFQSASLILTKLNVSEISNPNQFFFPGYRIWQSLIPKLNKYGQPLSGKEMRIVNRSIYEISEFLCIYLAQCTNEDFTVVMEVIADDYKHIVKASKNHEQRQFIEGRADVCNENNLQSLG